MTRLLRAAVVVVWALALHTVRNARVLRRPGPPAPVEGLVSVLVPARNEAERIAPCVTAALSSEGVELELVVLDDQSTDATADVVRAAGGGDGRLRLLDGTPPPPGWLGKPWACQQLADAARGDPLVFVDADVVLSQTGLAATVRLLREGRLDAVSPYPRQEADGVGPRLVQPLLQWSWLTFLPLRLAERSARPSMAVLNGQLLACRVQAYRAVGGHGAVACDVIEDVALARRLVRAGHRTALADGTDVATCRMYTDWAGLAEGYRKSLWAAFGSVPGAVTAAGLLLWLYIAPPLAAVAGVMRGRPGVAGLGLAGTAGGVVGRVVTARVTGGRGSDAVAHPLSVVALVWLLASSLRARATGRLRWRGRGIPG